MIAWGRQGSLKRISIIYLFRSKNGPLIHHYRAVEKNHGRLVRMRCRRLFTSKPTPCDHDIALTFHLNFFKEASFSFPPSQQRGHF